MISPNLKILNRIKAITVLPFVFLLSYQNTYSQVERIKKGSILEIRVYEHEELSRTVMVQPDGTVDFPLISNIPVDGFTLDEVREILKAQAYKYMGERPIISVRFSQTINVGVTVLGQVVVPGEYMVAKRATVQGAITRAGGTTPRAQLDKVKLIRKTDDNSQTVNVDLYKFYVEGNPDLLPSLEDGDIIVVPGLPGSYDVKVIGEVKMPGAYKMFTGANLIDALYMAGGPTERAALNKTRLVSPLGEQTREVEIDIDKFLRSKQVPEVPELRPGDIIYVPVKKNFWRTFISVLRDASLIAYPIVIMIYYWRR